MSPSASTRGQLRTVLGDVDRDAMGVTLPHEHLLVDCSCFFAEPAEVGRKWMAQAKVGLENRGWIHYHWTENLDNLRLWDEKTAAEEARFVQQAGGRTIVDPTNIGLGRDPAALARLARATGLNIVMGSGHYTAASHPPGTGQRTEESIADEIVADIRQGVGDTGVRAGFIGEIGCSWPWREDERKCMRGAAAAQRATGAALVVHPGRDDQAPGEILDFLAKEGVDLGRVVMCHVERTSRDKGWLSDLAARGSYIEYDHFGNESSYYPPNPNVDMPSDAQRMDLVLWHVEQGHGPQLLLSQDVATKTRLHRYGGQGYDHLLTNLAPRLRRRGLSAESVRMLLVDNPARAFCLPTLP
jgi:phosphotriesterase-related protein